MRRAVAARQFTLRVAVHNTLPPLISLSGHNPIQEAKAEALRNFVKSGPISPNNVCAMPVRMPGIWVRSMPKTRVSSDFNTPSAERAFLELLLSSRVSVGGGLGGWK